MDFIISDENDISIKCREKQIGVQVPPPPPLQSSKDIPSAFCKQGSPYVRRYVFKVYMTRNFFSHFFLC